MKNDILNLIIDKNMVISKSYLKNNNEWDTSRCRIDAIFFVESILYYFLTRENGPKLTEIFLQKTRNINKDPKEYKNSNGMDFSAIKNWFKLSNNTEEIKEELEKYKIADIEKVVSNYIDTIIKQQIYLEDKKIKSEWDIYSESKLISTYEDVKDKINDYINNQELKLLGEDDISNNCKIIKDKTYQEIKSSIENKTNIEVIGQAGEQFVYKFLINKYGEENIIWVSNKDKFANHDFQIKDNDDIRYVEVKTTTNYEMRRFFISKNEYNFYEDKKDNYDLYLVANVKPWIYDDNYTPTLIIRKSPIINIDLSKSGYENNEFFIMPYTFIANW